MRLPHTIAILALLLGTGCNESVVDQALISETKGMPDCVQNLKNNRDLNAAEIWSWVYDETTFYYVVLECCDQYNYLYDGDCNLICAPDGGITGAGDGQCPEIDEQVVKTLLWRR